jgi:hypothetical protein
MGTPHVLKEGDLFKEVLTSMGFSNTRRLEKMS